MAYIVGQYNHNNSSSDDASFITPITTGTATRYNGSSNAGGSGSLDSFSDECITNLSLVSFNLLFKTSFNSSKVILFLLSANICVFISFNNASKLFLNFIKLLLF